MTRRRPHWWAIWEATRFLAACAAAGALAGAAWVAIHDLTAPEG